MEPSSEKATKNAMYTAASEDETGTVTSERDQSDTNSWSTMKPLHSEGQAPKIVDTKSLPPTLSRTPFVNPKDLADKAKLCSEEIQNPAKAPPPPPPPTVDEATLKKRAAAARAYALSGETSSKKKANKAPPTNPAYAAPGSYAVQGSSRAAPGGNGEKILPITPPRNAPHPSHMHQQQPHYPYPPPPHHLPLHLHQHGHPPPYAYHPHYQYPLSTSPGGYPSRMHRPPQVHHQDIHAGHTSHYYPPGYAHPAYRFGPPHPAGPGTNFRSSPPPGYPTNHLSDTTMPFPQNNYKTTSPSRFNHPKAMQKPASRSTSSPPSQRRTPSRQPPPSRASSGHSQDNNNGSKFIFNSALLTRIPSASERLAAFSTAQAKTLPDAVASPSMPKPFTLVDKDDDDYVKFVRSLGLQDKESDGTLRLEEDDDDEEDFLLTSLDEDEDDMGDDEDDYDEDEEGDVQEIDECSDREGYEGPPESEPEPESVSKEENSTVFDTTKEKGPTGTELAEWDPAFYEELEAELGGLEEEDLEAAVASLLGTTSTSYALAQKQELADYEDLCSSNGHADKSPHPTSKSGVTEETSSENVRGAGAGIHKSGRDSPHSQQHSLHPPTTPLRQATGMRTKAVVTPDQIDRLQNLLKGHFQLLIQQAVLAIRAAHLQRTQRIKDKTEFLAGENGDDLVEILDGAIGMVQDMNQNRKDAIRNFIQFNDAIGRPSVVAPERRRTSTRFSCIEGLGSLDREKQDEAAESSDAARDSSIPREQRRLTRAAFSETLKQNAIGQKSVFDIKGFHRLQETFQALDNSVGKDIIVDNKQGQREPEYTEACRAILQRALADFREDLLPGATDISENFSNPQEYLGEAFEKPCNEDQVIFLRKHRFLFTSGEDNLVLRGVNLYGEKQWTLIADRFLSDRSINVISQRYSKLCVMLYKAHGISIDSHGNLEQPPKLESVDDINDEKVALIPKASPPAILNVHRWSLEEDLTLLKAVPLMGHMWAELGARLIPHRDRGHLRKRYQVLERRVKATMSRALKSGDPMAKLSLKIQQQRRSQKVSPPSKIAENGHEQKATGKRQSGGGTGTSSSASQPTSHTPNTSSLLTPNTKRASSRAAFEQLASETNAGWSQMSKIGDMIENGFESEIVGALANKLTKSSTTTVLEEAQEKSASSGGSSILDSVLERASGGGRQSHALVRKRKNLSTPPKASKKAKQQSNSSRKSGRGDGDGGKLSARSPSRDTAPSTPSSAASPNDDSVVYASGVGVSIDGVNMRDFDSRQVLEYGKTSDRPLEESTLSRKHDSSSGISFLNDPLMEENDLEAISALNSLSNSPARSLLKKPTTERTRRGLPTSAAKRTLPTTSVRKRTLPTSTAKNASEKGEQKEEDKSFFAKVLGGVYERDSKKRKLKF